MTGLGWTGRSVVDGGVGTLGRRTFALAMLSLYMCQRDVSRVFADYKDHMVHAASDMVMKRCRFPQLGL